MSEDTVPKHTPVEGRKLVAAILLTVIVFSVIVAAIYLTFDIIAFIGSIGILGLVLGMNPGIPSRIMRESQIMYYCIFLGVTLLFSIDSCKADSSIVLLVIVGIFATLISFYVNTTTMITIAMFVQLYIVLKILITYWKSTLSDDEVEPEFSTSSSRPRASGKTVKAEA